MKIFLSIALVFGCLLNADCQVKLLKSPPAEVLTSPVILSVMVNDKLFERVSTSIVEDLKRLNIDIVDKSCMSDNPRVNLKRMAEYSKAVKEGEIKYAIAIAFQDIAGPYLLSTTDYHKLSVNISITSTDFMNEKRKKVYHLQKNSYDAALKDLEKTLKKL